MLTKNGKFSRSDLIILFERLELYISSGLTLNKALSIAGEGINKNQKTSMNNIKSDIESGTSLSISFRRYLNTSATISGLIENGETSGNLGESLKSCRQLLEKKEDLRKKCISAMTYPVVIGLFALVLTIGLMRGIMPQIVPMLRSLHVQLPLLTRMVMAISDGLSSFGIYLLIFLILIIVLFIFSYKKYLTITRMIQNVLIHTPLVGQMIHTYFLSLFLLSCGSLIESGMGSPEAFENTVNTLSLISLKENLSQELETVKNGVPISAVMKKIHKIQPFVAPLLSAGEMSGTLGKSMLRASSILDREIEHSLKRMTSLIEPIMMAGMGIVVGAIALSIMMPIYDISKVLQK